jgi:ribonuclease BN (tRNA processing enzyme)
VLAYLPDHEPALGVADFPDLPEWTSGFDLAREADVLIHDAQYTEDEYKDRIGWGHSTFKHALDFAGLAGVKRLVTFHHDPGHSDEMLDGVLEEIRAKGDLEFELIPGRAGLDLCVE